MKTHQKSILFAALVALSFNAVAQDTETTEGSKDVKKKHIKIVTVEDGVTTKIDTIVSGDDDMVWFGDHSFENFEWDMENFPEMPDSAMMEHMKNFPPPHSKDGKGPRPRVHIYKGPGEFSEVREFRFDEGDSTRHMIFVKSHGEGGTGMEFSGDRPPFPPGQVHMIKHQMKNDPNMIDLNDPNIISFKKKDLSGDREKIEIIRKKSDDKEIEMETEVIIQDKDSSQ